MSSDNGIEGAVVHPVQLRLYKTDPPVPIIGYRKGNYLNVQINMSGLNLLTSEDIKKAADEIADLLEEKQHGPRKLVQGVVEQCGIDFAKDVLRDTDAIQEAGGMLTAVADRLRTKGGVFFYIARGRMSDSARDAIFPARTVRARRKTEAAEAHLPSFDWDARLEVLQPLIDEQGEVRSVKITLIGRPGKIEERQELVITTMSHTVGSPTMPRGVPAPPDTPTLYTVYMSAKQWRKIADTLNDPDDLLIIEGMCAFDPAISGVAVYASRITTKATEAQKRQTSDDKPNGKSESPKAAAPAPVLKATSEPTIPAGVPSNVAQKLRELHAAADLYRQKITDIESKPVGQQFGLDMTQKLLRDVEGKIADLEKQYA